MGVIQREPLYQQVRAELRNRIVTGQLKAGDRIEVQSLADSLGISRTPVREAVRQLVQEGLLEDSDDGRVRVYSPSPEDLADIYILRAALESSAAAIAIRTAPDSDLVAIQRIHEDGQRATEPDDISNAVECNTKFHTALLRLADSETAHRLLSMIEMVAFRYRTLAMHASERRQKASSGHDVIVELLRARDPEVETVVRNHILEAGAWAINYLKPDTTGDSRQMSYLRQFGDSGFSR